MEREGKALTYSQRRVISYILLGLLLGAMLNVGVRVFQYTAYHRAQATAPMTTGVKR